MILKVCQPDHADRSITKFSLTHANQVKSSAFGFELGSEAEYLLSVVHPLKIDQHQAGFVEIHIDVSSILTIVKQTLFSFRINE